MYGNITGHNNNSSYRPGQGMLITFDVLIVLAAILLYSLTLYIGPGGRVMPGDTAKFQYAGLVLGIPHTPGYPLYVMLTALWLKTGAWLEPATGVNFLSVIIAAGTLVVLHHAMRKAGISAAAGLCSVLMLMVTPVFWTYATQAGPGILSFFLMAVMLYCLLTWFDSGSESHLFTGIIMLCVAAGHDPVSIWFLVPVITLLIILHPAIVRTAVFWIALYCGLTLGFGVYVFVLIRSYAPAPLTEYVGHNVSAIRLIKTMFNAQFWPNYFVVGPQAILTVRLSGVGRMLFQQLPIAAFVLAFPGFLLAWQRSRKTAVLTLVFAMTAFMAVIHQFMTWPAGQFWPLYLLAGFWAGFVLDWFWRRKIIYGILFIGSVMLITGVPAASRAAERLRTNSGYELDDVFLAMTKSSVLLADDEYTWEQIMNYYRYTDPFIGKRELIVSSELRDPGKRAHYFISPDVKAQLDEAKIPYVPVYSNHAAQIYIIGRKKPENEIK